MQALVITFDHVTKRYPDGTVAVDDLSFTVPEGEILVLVGPSGCGKTTSMRMVNRMVEPSTGTITVDGTDVTAQDAPTLRRTIGYVIQQIGLFPHRTVAQNIATVPTLLGWDQAAVDARVAELIDTVGLTAAQADRFPHQLSGGQRQRVGVARALAADPPVLLMDEPFGAVDPIVRARLQQEFLSLQQRVRKTIVFVTHDIDEAIVMGDRIAILAEGGVLQQVGTPDEILATPANAFVEEFLGGERELRRLALIAVADLDTAGCTTIRLGETVQAAAAGWVTVVDDEDRVLGWVAADGTGPAVAEQDALRDFAVVLRPDDTARAALDALVASPAGVAVAVDADGRLRGLVHREQVTAALGHTPSPTPT